MDPERNHDLRAVPAAGAVSPFGSGTTKHYKRMQRNKYQSGGRDKPLFAARNQQAQGQSAYEEPRFLTDSLNTSFAPSPSPARQSNGSTIPRPALANGRARGSWTGAASPKNNARSGARGKRSESLVPNTLISPDKYNVHSTRGYKDRAARDRTGSPAKVGALGDRSPQQTTTPSPPPRGRGHDYALISPISNASDASPPRELNESYRRIKDEEVLAEQQGSGSETDPAANDSFVGSMDEVHQEALRDIVNGGLPEHLRSPTPSSRRNSRRFSPAAVLDVPVQDIVLPSVEDKENAGTGSGRSSPFDEITQEELVAQDSPSSARRSSRRSSSSNNSNPKEDHAKLQNLINGPPLFSKARPLRSTLFADEEKNGGNIAPSHRSSGDSRSVSSKGSDQSQGSQNGPVIWGRKARRIGPWLDRIKETASQAPLTTEFHQQQQDAQSHAQQEHDPVARPHGDERLKMGQVAKWVETSNAEGNQTHGSDSFQPDDTDEVAHAGKHTSVAISESDGLDVQPNSQRNSESAWPSTAKLDASQEQKHTSVEDSATNHHARAKKPDQQISKPTSGIVDGNAVKKGQSQPTGIFGFLRSGATVTQRKGENKQDHDEQPSQAHKPPQQLESQSAETITGGKTPSSEDKATEPENSSAQREDSRDLLRALARAESKSPSPASSRRNRILEEEQRPASKLRQERSPDSPIQERETSNRLSKPMPLHQKPEARETTEVALQSSTTPGYAKTPRVVGAWIDTPATQRVASSRQDITAQLEQLQQSLRRSANGSTQNGAKVAEQLPRTVEELASTAPKLKTALEEILEKAKADQNRRQQGEIVDSTVMIDDSTLQSLEELLGTPELSDHVTTESEQSVEHQFPGQGRNKGTKVVDDYEEVAEVGPASQAYQTLVSRLTHLGAHISDSRESMTALQRKVSRYGNGKSTGLTQTLEAEENICDEAGELHDFILVCPKCGSGGDPTLLRSGSPEKPFIEWQPVKFPVPKLWETSRDGGWPRITRRGLVVLTTFLLLLVNFVVDNANSPPFYANRMEGFGVDYHRPRPPFIIFKLTWKNVLAPLILPAWFSFCVFARFVSAIFGLEPGIFGHGDEYFPPTMTPSVADLGFGADEVL